MKYRLASIAIALALVNSACSTLDPESLAFADDGSRQEQTVIRVATYTTGGFIEAISEWEREHPTVDVIVDFRPIDEHHRQLSEPSIDTMAPDVIAIESSYIASFRDMTGLLGDLSDQISTPMFPPFIDWRLEQGRAADGTLRALPVDVGGLALAYRSDLLGDLDVPMSELGELATWCDLVAVANSYSLRSGNAFFAGSADLFEAVLMQSEQMFHDVDGRLVYDSNPAVRRAWDLAMSALAIDPLFEDPCPEIENAIQVTAGLNSMSDDWTAGLGNDDFAAMLAPAWLLSRIQNTVPETSGSWRLVPIPGTVGNVGGTHLAVSATSQNADLARDLVAYLTASVTQRAVFGTSGRLPAIVQDNVELVAPNSATEFFGGSNIGQTYADSVDAFVPAPVGPDFRLILREFRSGIARVEAGELSSAESWTETLWRLDQILG